MLLSAGFFVSLHAFKAKYQYFYNDRVYNQDIGRTIRSESGLPVW